MDYQKNNGQHSSRKLGRMNKFWFTSWKFLRSLFGLWLKVCLREGMGWILYGDYDISSMVLYV